MVGDELITPIYTPPTRPTMSTPRPAPPNGQSTDACDDEDDCTYHASGDSPDKKNKKGK